MLGLTQYQGDLTVLGRNPWTQRDALMRDVCFIADVAVLPRWMRVSQALDYSPACIRVSIAPRPRLPRQDDIRRTARCENCPRAW